MSKKSEGGSGSGSATVSEDSGQDAITDMCVLLVEDDAVARKCAEAALRSCGYRVIAAENGREALDILKSKESEKIDLILTDILMPEVNGLQLLDNVVHSSKWKKLPVTVMSSQDSIDTAAKCIQNGAVEFLAKPVRKHKLTNLWQHVLRRKSGNESSAGETEGQEAAGQAPESAAKGATAAGGAASSDPTLPQASAQALDQGASLAAAIAPQILANQAAAGLLPAWANQLPQAIVEIAFKTSNDLQTLRNNSEAKRAAVSVAASAAAESLHHSNSCSAFSAFIRCREGSEGAVGNPSTSGNGNMMTFASAPSQLAGGVLPHPLQVSNLNIVQQHSGGFRGSGMLKLQNLAGEVHQVAKRELSEREGATERRQEAIRKFREKKKARTFKKKVRYESRKRLAEARPRIKGQFVRPEVAAAAAAAAAAAGVAAGVAAKSEAQQQNGSKP